MEGPHHSLRLGRNPPRVLADISHPGSVQAPNQCYGRTHLWGWRRWKKQGLGYCSLTASVNSSWSGGLTVALDWAHSSVPSPTSVPESSSWTKNSYKDQESLINLGKWACCRKPLHSQTLPEAKLCPWYKIYNRPLMEEVKGTGQATVFIAWKIMAT